MANMHILDATGTMYRVAFHIPIPGGSNSAGVPWQTALVNSGLGGQTILPDGDGNAGTISAAEKASIQNGSLIEVIDELDLYGLTGPQINALLDAHYTARQSEAQAEFSNRLRQYGRNR
jgi:hypothetical protein